MTESSVACVILAAGKGTRMNSDLPKVLHSLAGRPMIGHVLDAVTKLAPERVVVVVGPEMEAVTTAVAPVSTVIQTQPLGTADAVRAAAPALVGFTGDVLVLYGDTPLVTVETLNRMIAARRAASNPAVVVLGMRPANAGAYGRLICTADGSLERIVEYLDANEEERAETLCNAGLMAFDGRRLFELLDRIDDANKKREYYLTDVVSIARNRGYVCSVVSAPENEVRGVNARSELAEAERLMQERLRQAAMDNGATLIDPGSVFLSVDTQLGRDVTIGPSVVFGLGVTIGNRVEIRAFSHLEQAQVADGAVIGPFARLRPGTRVASNAHIGNFVEVKNADIGAGAKVNHLTYIGDAVIGAKANIGAGTITCNYDGFAKHQTEIGAGAFIGSNASLVAPVKIGDGAMVGAGSVVTVDVDPDALAVARGRQKSYPGWAARFRSHKR